MTEPESGPDAYDRGVIAGGIEQRLAGHDKHFQLINGNLEKIAARLGELALAVQRLADQAVARDATVVTTAAALRDAEQARRDSTEQSWSPWQRLFAGLGALAALSAVVALIVALTK